jgi:hypothetical protein
MTTISIIGSGNMATAIGTRAAKHGHTIELMTATPPRLRHSPTRSATEPPPARSAQRRWLTSSSWPSHTPTRFQWSRTTASRWPARSS